MFDYGSFKGKSSSSSSWLKRQQESLQQQQDSEQLQKSVNLMLARQEPLDKIARDLNLDYNTLKSSVSKINPNYERDVTNKSKSPIEQAITGVKQFVWDDVIINEFVNPAVGAFDAWSKTKRAQDAVAQLNNYSILKKNREYNRQQLFGNENKWTDAQRNDKNFMAKVQKYDAETNAKLSEYTKKIDYKALKESANIDPLKAAMDTAQTFLNVAGFGFVKGFVKAVGTNMAKAAGTSAEKKIVQISGKELLKIPAKELPGKGLAELAAEKLVKEQAQEKLIKVIGKEMAKEVPFGAAYGITYTGRNVDQPTMEDYLKNALVGGAFAVPFSVVLPIIGRANGLRLQKKAESVLIKEAQRIEDVKLRNRVQLGEITQAEARRQSREYAKQLPDLVKNLNFTAPQTASGATFGTKLVTSAETGIGKQVAQKEVTQAAELAAQKTGAKVATGVAQDVTQTAATTADEATNAVIRDLENQIAQLESVPVAERTNAQNLKLAEVKSSYDNVLQSVKPTEARLAPDMTTGAPSRALTPSGQPVTAPGEVKLAAGQPIQGRVFETRKVTAEQAGMPTGEVQAPSRVQILQGFMRTNNRINKLAQELERLNMVDAAKLTPRQMARQRILEASVNALKQRPDYQAVMQTIGGDVATANRSLDQMLQEVYATVKANGGITIDLGGNKPKEGFAFAPYKDTEKIVRQEEFSANDIGQYIDDHISELNKPGSHLGIWVDGDNIYLDVSKVGDASPETIAQAQEANQLAVFDLKSMEDIPTGQITKDGVYNKVDEATNIFNQYTKQIKGTAQERGVGGVSEVPTKETAGGAATGQPATQEVGKEFKGAGATATSEKIPAGFDTQPYLVSDIQKEIKDGRITSRVLDKLNSMVSKGIDRVVDPIASTTFGSKMRQAINTIEKRLYFTQADAVRPIIEGIKKELLPANARVRIEEAIRSVRTSTQQAQMYMLDNADWMRVVAPVPKNGVIKEAILNKKELKKLNEYIGAKAELNVMKIDGVKDPVRQKQFEETVAKLETPDYKERYDALVKYNDGLLDKLVEGGIVSEENAAMWRATNTEYVRIQRVMDDISLRNREGFGGKATASFGSTITEQRRVGSTRQIRDLVEAQAERTERIFFELEKNRASNLMVDMYKQLGQEFADPIRLAENVFTRKALRESLMESKPLKTAFNRFYKSQKAYTARIQSEVDKLNKQGLNAYLKGGVKDKKAIDLSTRIKILREIDPNVPLEAIKADGKWRFGQAPDINTVKSAMARTKYRNGLTGEYTDTLKTYAKRNGLSEDEALVKLYMKERKFDGFEYGNKEFVINDAKLAKKAGEMVVKGETKGKFKGVTAGAPKKMGLQNTVDAVDNLVSYQTSDLLAIKRKIANREPKLAQAIDELVNIKSQLDEINLKRKAEWEEIMQKADKTQNSMPTINRFVNGIKETYITQPEIEAAVKGWDAAPLNAVMRALNIPTRVLKTTITGALNPAYTVKALIRDPIESFVLSPNARATHSAPNVWRAITESVGKDPLFKEFMRTEGGTSAFIDYVRKPKDAAALIREQSRLQLPKVQRGMTVLKSPKELWRKIEDTSRWQEHFSRWMNFRGAYDDAIKRGLSQADALVEARWASRNNQVDFFRGGDWSPILNSLYPYFNSSLQGGARLGRAFREKPVTTSLKIITAIQIPQAVVTMYNLSDPRRAEIYLDIPDYERANNWVFVLPGSEKTKGRWETVKIPKPPGVGAFAAPIEAMGIAMYGYDPQKYVDLTQAFVQGSGLPIQASSINQAMGSLVPQVLKPGIQAVTNYDFFTGKEIVPAWMRDAQPEPYNQAFDNTSSTAKSIAKMLNFSPIAVEKFISDTMGEFGKNALFQVDSSAQALGLTKERVGGKSTITSLFNTVYTSPGGTVHREVKNQIEDVLNSNKSTSALITELVNNDDIAGASRVAQDYNNKVDVLVAQIYAKPDMTSVSPKQINYLESQKFPLKNGTLTKASIKYRQKQAPQEPIKFELK